MKNTQNQTVVRSVVLLSLALALVIFLAGAYGPVPVASGQNPRSDQVSPAAIIDKIVVNETNQIEALGNVIVTRANGEKVQAVTTGLLLFRGDAIETAKNTKVTVLFLDSPVSERHNQIIIDGDAKVAISSGDSWWGRVWTKVKETFYSRTTYVQVGAHGTEYEFTVSRDGRQATVVMLEGDYLDVTRGNFALLGRLADIGPVQKQATPSTPQFMPVSFAVESSAQEQPGRSLDVPSGQMTSFEVTYNVFNECHQGHRFEFRTSDDARWLQLEVQKTWDIAPSQRLPIQGRLNIDARQLSQGLHRARVYVVCLDCDQEPQCPGRQLDWPYNVTVSGTGTITTPTPTPTRDFRLAELEETLVPNSPEPAGPRRASDDRVRAVLEWTNGVILKTQPSYSAEGLIPHFAAEEQRSQTFRTAREQAILRHLPGSNKLLGDVYSDWGQAAQAAKAYDIERKNLAGLRTPPEGLSMDQAEAERLMGKPDQARERILASADSRSAAAQNLLGNVYADYARIALDKKDWGQARTHLDQAESFYRTALSSLAQGRPGATAGDGAVQANLARTQILQGDLLLQEVWRSSSDPQAALAAAPQINAVQLARTKYTSAIQLLSRTQPAESTYPFGVKTLGRAHQGLGDAAMLAGEAAAARDSYANAKSHYNRVISAHPDCAEAYFSLGDLYDDLGDTENAKLNYRKAIQTRPEQPASYYPLAVLLQAENPQLARALAATYLKLEPEVFQQGEKKRNAERIIAGTEQVPLTPRIGTIKPTGSTVPGVVNMTQNDAVNALKAAGFVANVRTRTDPRSGDVVLEQKPVGGSPAPRGSTVDILVNTTSNVPLIVPDVLSRSESDARAAIESAGFTVGKVERKDDKHLKDTVIKQKPEGGKSAKRGSPVNLEISGGILIEVPDLIGKDEEDAKKKLVKDLAVGRIEREASCNVGKVLRQSRPRHEKVEPGTPVDLVIGSLGDNPVTIPRFIGGNRNDVEIAIRERRFILSRVRTEETDDAPPGTVMNQSPGENTQFAQECPVKIEITVAAPLTTVGDYVGLAGADAQRQVSGSGLSAIVRSRESQGQPGVVIDQSPPAGSRVRRSFPVTLVISVSPVQLITVPDVVRKSLIDARNTLEGAGLKLGRVTYEEPEAATERTVGIRRLPGCTVTRQDPIKDRQVRPGTPVNVWVIRQRDANGRPSDCLNANSVGDH